MNAALPSPQPGAAAGGSATTSPAVTPGGVRAVFEAADVGARGHPHRPRDPRTDQGRRGRRPARHPDPRRRRSPAAWPPRSSEVEGRDVRRRLLDITLYRDDLRLRAGPRAGAHRRPGGDSTASSSSSSTTCCSPAARSGPRSTRSATSAGRRPSSSPSWSTAVTASCRSGPTTSARTCRRRGARQVTVLIEEVDGRDAVSLGARPRRPRNDEAPDLGRRPEPRRRAAHPRHRRALARAGRPPGQEAADAARPHRREPLLRGLHPHPHLVRGRGQTPVRRRHQLLRQGLQRLQGREPEGHRAHPEAMGADAVVIRHQASGAPHRLAELGERQRRQRRRRHARAPHPGAARRLHHAPAPRRTARRTTVAIVGDVLHSGWPDPTRCCCTTSAPR